MFTTDVAVEMVVRKIRLRSPAPQMLRDLRDARMPHHKFNRGASTPEDSLQQFLT